MESTGYRHLRSPSGDRFLGVFSFSPPPASVSVVTGDELNEDEVCFSDDFTDPQKARHRRSTSSSTSNDSAVAIKNRHRQHWLLLSRQLQSSGILAALPGGATPSNIVIPSMSPSPPSRPIPPAIPKKSPQDQERELPQSAPHRKFQQSAPVSVPVLSPAMWKQHKNRFFEADDDSEDEEMLPPHEIVARGSGASPRTTFSVLEGAGRTLKGRDLRQVRNAIWRKTGFLD